MKYTNIENIYNEIMLLSNTDRQKLYDKMGKEFCLNNDILAYTTAGKPLTKNEYIEQINIGLKQIENGEMLSDDELQKEIETW